MIHGYKLRFLETRNLFTSLRGRGFECGMVRVLFGGTSPGINSTDSAESAGQAVRFP